MISTGRLKPAFALGVCALHSRRITVSKMCRVFNLNLSKTCSCLGQNVAIHVPTADQKWEVGERAIQPVHTGLVPICNTEFMFVILQAEFSLYNQFYLSLAVLEFSRLQKDNAKGIWQCDFKCDKYGHTQNNRHLTEDERIRVQRGTNRDQACMNALDRSFPDLPSLVCRWHMNRNVLAKTRTRFGQVEIENPAPGQDKYENTVATDQFLELYYDAVEAPSEAEFESRCAIILIDPAPLKPNKSTKRRKTHKKNHGVSGTARDPTYADKVDMSYPALRPDSEMTFTELLLSNTVPIHTISAFTMQLPSLNEVLNQRTNTSTQEQPSDSQGQATNTTNQPFYYEFLPPRSWGHAGRRPF
ncbi:uncharacterized protein PITG_13189 [Phytophthora infestans T30-4]|uniref:MULE transposase domain-containing protein n=1 Tax=Phytophthora infestans (strain T30-4) TaxID=403677 RepID=D0NJT4_PHYIT|nr:uncharacterized protein PITG_13189 [Phytophthora infestans T30-4]EEY60020.1 hypothetical protein PITG_13189 [Phytophthora infestans T30-4]|eukprot:XP_002900705.1 hypothetical protein PITG_13189 [Phytophthora infestans T30-4]